MATSFEFDPDSLSNCFPRVVADVSRCGGITACDLAPLTTTDIDTVYFDEGAVRSDGALVEADMIGKACQIQQNVMYDWLRAASRTYNRSVMLDGGRANDGRKYFRPFVIIGRKGLINDGYWHGTRLADVSGEIIIQLVNPPGIELPYTTKYVQPGQRFTLTLPGAGGTVSIAQVRVLADADQPAGYPQASSTGIRVAVELADVGVIENSIPTAGSATVFVVTPGTANVAPREVYCPEGPVLNTYSEAYMWAEYNRLTLCDNQLTQEWMQEALRNPAYKKFFHVPDVERNRQELLRFQKRMANQFWFGKPTNANQTPASWTSLPTVTLPSVGPWAGTECVGRKADSVGVLEQLAQCNDSGGYSPYQDLLGASFSIPQLLRDIYQMYRVRQSNGTPSNVFEIWTNTFFANQLATAFVRYFNMRMDGNLRFNIDGDGREVNSPFGLVFRSFKLDYPAGVELRIMAHPFFDDFLTTHTGADMSTQGEIAALIDWSTTYMATIESRTVKNVTGNVQQLSLAGDPTAACMTDVPTKTYTHREALWTTVVECPKANKVYTNFSCEVPSITDEDCPT